MIAKDSTMIPKLLKEYHDSVIGGHAGETKTYLKIAADWFWVGMKHQVVQYVRSAKFVNSKNLHVNIRRGCRNHCRCPFMSGRK